MIGALRFTHSFGYHNIILHVISSCFRVFLHVLPKHLTYISKICRLRSVRDKSLNDVSVAVLLNILPGLFSAFVY